MCGDVADLHPEDLSESCASTLKRPCLCLQELDSPAGGYELRGSQSDPSGPEPCRRKA